MKRAFLVAVGLALSAAPSSARAADPSPTPLTRGRFTPTILVHDAAGNAAPSRAIRFSV